MDTTGIVDVTAPEPSVGQTNVRVAWWMIGGSMALGAVLGLWSFGGPLPAPPGFRAFDDLPRRLVRLGHIAGIALLALNLLYVPWMARARATRGVRAPALRDARLAEPTPGDGLLASRRRPPALAGDGLDRRRQPAGCRPPRRPSQRTRGRLNMRIGLIALSGVRVRTAELAALGVTLPGFLRRGRVIAALPSLGLFTVAGLTPPGHEVHYLEVDALDGLEPLPTFDLVGISSFTARIDAAYALADRFRARGIPVVLGGLHVSLLPDEALIHADAVVVGGAEGVWPRLVNDAAAGRLARRYVGARDGVFRPALYAAPRFDFLAGRAYNRVTVQTSRGCPRACEFCAASLRITSRYNQKPVDRVIAEIRAARRHVAEPFFELADDNTFLDRRWTEEFLRAVTPEGIRYFTETDVSVADDPALCDRLAASGCRQLLIGFESPRADDLTGLDPVDWKRRRAPHLRRVIDTLQTRGVSVNGCFILGLDTQTPDVFPEILEFVRDSGLAEVQYTVLTPFPGTPLHARLKREGRLLQERFWDRCTLFDVTFRPKRMTVDQLETGLRWLFTETYSRPETEARLQHLVAQRREARQAAHRATTGGAARGEPGRPDGAPGGARAGVAPGAEPSRQPGRSSSL
jgi:radical SAM superfamily enzyme YgiQ (UPF0313 family)